MEFVVRGSVEAGGTTRSLGEERGRKKVYLIGKDRCQELREKKGGGVIFYVSGPRQGGQ